MKKKSLSTLIFCLTLIFAPASSQAYTLSTFKKIVVSTFLMIGLSSSYTIITNTVDLDGNVGEFSSLNINILGNPVISYYDKTNGDLKVAVCGNPTCAFNNTITTVSSSGIGGSFTSLKLNNKEYPVISYYHGTDQDLKLVVCGNPTCTFNNTIVVLDTIGNVGADVSLGLNKRGHPVICYFDVTNLDLKLAVCGNPTCASNNVLTAIDTDGYVGRHCSLEFNSEDNPVISYSDESRHSLKLVVCDNPTCSGNNIITTIDANGHVGRHTSLELNSAGNPVISYIYATNYDLKLAVCHTPTCTGANTLTIVEANGQVYGNSPFKLNIAGNPIISYKDYANGALRLVICGNPTCDWSVSSNTIITVDDGNVGEYFSFELNSAGNPVISYHDETKGTLKLATVLINPITSPTNSPTSANPTVNPTTYPTKSPSNYPTHMPSKMLTTYMESTFSAEQKPLSKSNDILIIGIVVVVALLITGLIHLFFYKKYKKDQGDSYQQPDISLSGRANSNYNRVSADDNEEKKDINTEKSFLQIQLTESNTSKQEVEEEIDSNDDD